MADFIYRGKTLEELKALSLKEFALILPARQRRTLLRGLKPSHKILLEKLKDAKKPIKTHVRDAIILPEMIGKTVSIYNGKQYIPLIIGVDMIGHFLGEFSLTRNSVKHSAPGVGATKSSAAVSVR
jgi:small subunit ribosomal protein S19